MSTLVCVPLFVHDVDETLVLAARAKDAGADIVEFRIDPFYSGDDAPEEAQSEADEIRRLVAESPLPCIVTCRPTWEGGEYDGPEDARISLFEHLAAADSPPAYIDVELKAYEASDNIRQKIHLACQHPKQLRDIRTRLILSTHDFEGRPSDLTRRLSRAWGYAAASIVKVAYRCRSIRDNLELFEILRDAPKPTIALGMGEFGLMSRVLAPKFGGYLTFASLTDTSTTAPGQPTIAELLQLYRFKSIDAETSLYGVIGWPVSHSMSPLIHNIGFEVRGVNAVYLPMPVAADPDDDQASDASFKATVTALTEQAWFRGASVTIPHKERLATLAAQLSETEMWSPEPNSPDIGAFNTIRKMCIEPGDPWQHGVQNTDVLAMRILIDELCKPGDISAAVIGAGGVARAALAAFGHRSGQVTIYARRMEQAERVATVIGGGPAVSTETLEHASVSEHDLYINCTPVGMTGGPAPDESPIDIDALFEAGRISSETVFFDTVYNPIETPMLRAAKAHGCRVVDGVQMFVKQAAAQFELWTGEKAPVELFDRLVREKLSE